MANTQRNNPIDVENLQGSYTALITPMYRGNGLNNPIDYPKLYKLIQDQVNAGITGFVVAGTTGQTATLLPGEHVDFVEQVFNHIQGNFSNLQFIVGAGSNSTNEAINLSREIESRIGPSTFLHVTGYYNNPPQEGIIAHFEKLSESLPCSNVILYNVPSRTGSKIEPDTVVHLANNTKNIIGIKEASGNMDAVKRIIQHTNSSRFRILSGEDDLVAKIMEIGGMGVISASANIAPKYFVGITKEALAGDFETAHRLQNEINPLVKEGVFYRKNPIPLAHMFDTELRLPLVKLPCIEPQIQHVLLQYTSEQLGINLGRYNKGI